MKASELIKQVSSLIDEHGDLPVSIMGDRLKKDWINIERHFKIDNDNNEEPMVIDIWKML